MQKQQQQLQLQLLPQKKTNTDKFTNVIATISFWTEIKSENVQKKRYTPAHATVHEIVVQSIKPC